MASDLILSLQTMGMDTDGALRRFSGNRALYEKFLLKFSDDDNFAKAMDALAAGDWEELFKAAHTIKGVAGNLGLTTLYESSAAVVSSLRADDQEGARTACESLARAYQALIPVLSAAAEGAS